MDHAAGSPVTGGPSPVAAAPALAKLGGRAEGRVVYRGLHLIDGAHEGVQYDMALVVENDVIARALPNAEATSYTSQDAEIIDVAGLYAVPGLIDAHMHLATLPNRSYAQAQMKRMLYGGITAVRDMAGDMRALADLARASLVNEIAAPDLFYSALMCGPDFFNDPRAQMATLGVTPGLAPWAQAVDKNSDMPLAIAKARGTWATGAKLYACMCGATVKHIIAEAKRQDFPVWAHLKIYPANPMDAVGATTVSHACMLAHHILNPNISDYWSSRRAHFDYAALSLDVPEIKAYISALAAAGTIVEPTLLVEREIEVLRSVVEANSAVSTPHKALEAAGEVTRAMHAAGVQIAAGTDFPSDPDDPYPSLQSELELLVRYGGLTASEALASATRVNARALGKDAQIGTLEPGKQASFVLIKDNPLDNITNLRSVQTTVKRGHRFARAAYQHDPARLVARDA